MPWARTLLLLCLAMPLPAFANECEDAASLAEHEAGLPQGLLAAIGRVESGRRGEGGHVAPWPWSVNAAGQGYYRASRDEALALVRSLQARGVQSIDVGCFQMNLFYHPLSFASLEDAFDPRSNARAAAGFLHTLQGSLASWADTVGHYHSADPARGGPYARMVMASWHGGADMPSPPLSQVAQLVRVYGPGGAETGLVRNAGSRLPVVIVPSGSRL